PTVGVHGFYNEVYPYWAHTGPQLYLVTQMVWDVSRDPLDVMERYYSRMFREVAGQMRRFYEILETVWTTSTKPGRWFEGLNDPHTQAWRWTPTQREEAWQAIHQAHEAVIDDVTRKRIQYVLDGFHHAYLYMKAFHRAVALREVKHPDSLREQIVRLAGLVDAREQVYLNVLQDDETYPTVYYRDTPESDGSPSRFAKLIAKWRQSIGMRIEEALDGHDELRKTLVAENATVQSLISDAEDDLRW
ncbi:MAG: hypothetical protein QGH20_05745, partial [Candidatus Latescibacteria bacterium]|nr:hypothetical protein [Candidatus Latescibacterota bacterium]